LLFESAVLLTGDHGSTVAKVLRYKSEGRLFDPRLCQWIFSLTKNPSDRTNRNEYQEYLLGVKAAGAKADNLPPSCADFTKSGNLNFLEPSGPVQVFVLLTVVL